MADYFTVNASHNTGLSTSVNEDLVASSHKGDTIDSGIFVIGLCSLVPLLLYSLLIYVAPSLLLGKESQWVMNSLWGVMPKALQSNRIVHRILHQ